VVAFPVTVGMGLTQAVQVGTGASSTPVKPWQKRGRIGRPLRCGV